MDIVVTLPCGDLDHLLTKINAATHGLTAWWRFRRMPKNFEARKDKIFIVSGGKLRGYFTTAYREAFKTHTNVYFGNEWVNVKPVSMKGFQGFRYRRIDYSEDVTEDEWLEAWN